MAPRFRIVREQHDAHKLAIAPQVPAEKGRHVANPGVVFVVDAHYFRAVVVVVRSNNTGRLHVVRIGKENATAFAPVAAATAMNGPQKLHRAIVGDGLAGPAFRQGRLRHDQMDCTTKEGRLLENVEIVQQHVRVADDQLLLLLLGGSCVAVVAVVVLEQRQQVRHAFNGARGAQDLVHDVLAAAFLGLVGVVVVDKVTTQTQVVAEVAFRDGFQNLAAFAGLSKVGGCRVEGGSHIYGGGGTYPIIIMPLLLLEDPSDRAEAASSSSSSFIVAPDSGFVARLLLGTHQGCYSDATATTLGDEGAYCYAR